MFYYNNSAIYFGEEQLELTTSKSVRCALEFIACNEKKKNGEQKSIGDMMKRNIQTKTPTAQR